MTYLPGFENPIGYIEGIRQWRIVGGLLESICSDFLWEPWKVAEIEINIPRGIHAAKPEHEKLLVYEPIPGGIMITGAVALWGKVIEHERGYRAQYAYPIAFDHCTDRHIDLNELREIYLQPPTERAQIIVRERLKCISEKKREPSQSIQSQYQNQLTSQQLALLGGLLGQHQPGLYQIGSKISQNIQSIYSLNPIWQKYAGLGKYSGFGKP